MNDVADTKTLGGDNSDHPVIVPARDAKRLSLLTVLRRVGFEVAVEGRTRDPQRVGD